MKRILPIFLLLCAMPAMAATWFVRADGGTRYSVNVTSGQCDGLTDVAYPGSGTNQHCAYNDVRYLWTDNSGVDSTGWVISGGDTVVIRGCHALASQSNPDNPHCRIGSDLATGRVAGNTWCNSTTANSDCYNLTIPAGTSGAHTRILGGCAYDGNCSGGATNPKTYAANLTQLYGGFGLLWTFNLTGTQYVDVAGLEFTEHNGTCSTRGIPTRGSACSSSSPYSDYADAGIATDNTTANVNMTDVYLHGFTSYGLVGPIGGAITMTRVFSGFNPSAGWMFDRGDVPNAAGSSITASYVTMIGNGCQEEYPIVDAYPGERCWDDNSGGFGDAWSGQDSDLDTLICDHCVTMYNTKDGDIGPHTRIRVYTKTNSISAFNMGQQWKWGSSGTTPQTVDFENNLTVGGCNRMANAITGWPAGFNTYLSDFCRASGDGMSPNISPSSVWTIANNTFVFNSPTLFNVQCYPTGGTACASTIHWFNNVVLGYANIPTVYGTTTPAVFFNPIPSIIVINSDHEVEFGIRNGSTCGGDVICSDPLLLNEPAQSVTAQSDLDVFTNTVSTSSFYPTSSSPMIHAGTSGGPATDYFGVTQTSPATIGAVVNGGTPANTGSVLLNIIIQGTLTK